MKELVHYRVCDLCGAEPASSHNIVHNGRTVQIDLCAHHSKPLEDLFTRFALASTKAPGYSTSPHRCLVCQVVLSRRSHALHHVVTQHGYRKEEAHARIQPTGARVVQPLNGPTHQPHRCTICGKPYANASTAKRHVRQVHHVDDVAASVEAIGTETIS